MLADLYTLVRCLRLVYHVLHNYLPMAMTLDMAMPKAVAIGISLAVAWRPVQEPVKPVPEPVTSVQYQSNQCKNQRNQYKNH